ncbi:MAG: hypothetical protein LBH20_10285 [Treponema sp.]|jgi:hypothetical protein|nr:hypothetical protein [Treponema sp.]
MKSTIAKLLAAGLLIMLAAAAIAQEQPEQEIRINGYAKSGIFWNKSQYQGMDKITEEVKTRFCTVSKKEF